MVTRRRAFSLGSMAIVLFSAALFAQTTPAPRKLSNAEKKEIETVLKIVDGVIAGQPAPNEVSLAWLKEDYLKAQGNKQYVPFSVSVDPSKMPAGKISFYWRVVSKDAAAAPAADAKDAKKDDKKAPGKPEYPYEDLNTIAIEAGAAAPMRVSRSFTVGITSSHPSSLAIAAVTVESNPPLANTTAR